MPGKRTAACAGAHGLIRAGSRSPDLIMKACRLVREHGVADHFGPVILAGLAGDVSDQSCGAVRDSAHRSPDSHAFTEVELHADPVGDSDSVTLLPHEGRSIGYRVCSPAEFDCRALRFTVVVAK